MLNLNKKTSKSAFQSHTFKWAVGVSIVVHVIIFLKVPALRTATYQKIKKALEVTYDKLTEGKGAQRPRRAAARSEAAPYTEKLLKDIPLPSMGDEAINPKLSINKNNKLQKIPIALADSEKKIDIVGIKSDIPKTKAYEVYSEKVRQSIRRHTYGNFTKYQEGHVYVSFVVLRDGTLYDVLVHHDKSTPDAYLKRVVLESVKDAAPFDKFPLELNYPRITYSVTVSFELQ